MEEYRIRRFGSRGQSGQLRSRGAGLLHLEQLALDPGTLVNDHGWISAGFEPMCAAAVWLANIPCYLVIAALDAGYPPCPGFRFFHAMGPPDEDLLVNCAEQDYSACAQFTAAHCAQDFYCATVLRTPCSAVWIGIGSEIAIGHRKPKTDGEFRLRYRYRRRFSSCFERLIVTVS